MSDTPQVGDGATSCGWTDRHAGTIIEVLNDKTVVWQRDKAIRTDDNGMSDAQAYRYERDPDGVTMQFSLRKNGRWIARGGTMKGGTILSIGVRMEYYDYSF